MLAKLPYFTALYARLDRFIFIKIIFNNFNGFIPQIFKTELTHIKIEYLPKFDIQQIRVPFALVRFVVREPERLYLLSREIVSSDDRHFLHAELLRREQSSVPDNKHVLGVHDERLSEAELADAVRDVRHLIGGMLFRVPFIRRDRRDRQILDIHF